ncbi:MAG: L-histidine N(alpha)-methyltransferase [Pseudomonadales bacterium]|nr:L-histidine N(alpha)-methyltransferase [Pseudomonadales bacterium]
MGDRVGEFAFFDYEPGEADMASEVIEGLKGEPKQISPKYFYDQRGSELFEAITELEEYYLTRTELGLFEAHLDEVASLLGDNLCVVEYGSGSSLKIRKLLEAVTPNAYVPIDISQEHLKANAQRLYEDYPWLRVYPVCADFSQPLTLPAVTDGLRKVGFFPGSSIGNFEPSAACQFLTNVHSELGSGGALLIGVDRKKPVEILVDAYNDAKGVTAEFNLNVLSHLNARLRATFDIQQFDHDARYNEHDGCIQMFLRSRTDQVVEVDGQPVRFDLDEELHTENSYKFHPEEFLAIAAEAGFKQTRQWTDEQDWFALFLLEAL